MKYFLPTVYVVFQCSYVLCSSLPAPVNVTVRSVNFHHVLHWDPGPGTPPGTTYTVSLRKKKKTQPKVKSYFNITTTMHSLRLKEASQEYTISVQAFHNLSGSASTQTVFTPFTQTVIGPPIMSMIGCGNCLQLNIMLPEANITYLGKTTSMEDLYPPSYRIEWGKAGEKQVRKKWVSASSYKLDNLEEGVEYCVRVSVDISSNRNTPRSELTCAYTSIVPASRVPAVLAGVAVLLIVGGLALMVLIAGLVYTGVLCKLKTYLPRPLLAALVEGYFLTPERTVPDLVSVGSEEEGKTVRPKQHHTAEGSNPAAEDEEEEEEEEEGNDGYTERPTGLSPDTSTGRQSQESSGASVAFPNAAGHSGELGFEVVVEEEGEKEAAVGGTVVLGGQGQEEVQGDGVGVLLGLDKHGAVGGEEETKEVQEKEWKTYGNVNLFSVTLGALEREDEQEKGEEEGEQNATHFLRDSSVGEKQPLLPIDIDPSTSDRVGPQSERHTGKLTLEQIQTDRHVDRTENHSAYLVTHAGTVQTADDETEDEEEEEDESSGYIGR